MGAEEITSEPLPSVHDWHWLYGLDNDKIWFESKNRSYSEVVKGKRST